MPGTGIWHRAVADDIGLADCSKNKGSGAKAVVAGFVATGTLPDFLAGSDPQPRRRQRNGELAKRNRLSAQAGFINAVLRGYLREFDATKELLADLKVNQPHIGYSHPDWLVERWQKQWGKDLTLRLLEWNNSPPKTFARVNTLKADPGKLLTQ